MFIDSLTILFSLYSLKFNQKVTKDTTIGSQQIILFTIKTTKMKKLINHLIGDVKEFECGYKGSNESNSSIYIAIMLFIVLMLGICSKGFSNDTIKKPNVIVTLDGNFKELPKEILTNKIYTTIDGKTFPVYKTPNDKYFIKKISPKTNKEYKYYLVY